ncbi:hypothetical protein P0Y35_02070 [Kiritimatiellaeota bacterium B1221]|nr:hypothetical protein [Kiritimatiellaeota bacterium B1221]
MYLRLRKSLVVAWLLISISYTLDLSATEKKFEIPYFPEVMFKETPLTVHVNVPGIENVNVVINDEVAESIIGAGHALREYTLVPETGIRLSFQLENSLQEWSFKVLEPGFAGELREQDGFLYRAEVPVILMPGHRLPPPLDRRWETVEFMEHMIQNEKAEPGSVLMVAPDGESLPRYIQSLFPRSKIQMHPPDPEAWFRVHGYLTSPVNVPADFLVVETDFFDFERGMSPQTWFMKWQFLLQHLERRCGFKDGLLFSPAYSSETMKWKPVLDEKLKGLASAHGLRFIDRSREESIWQARLVHQLGNVYQLP